MTTDDFRQLALSLPDVQERHVLGCQEFRVRDRIFATLGSPDPGHAVLKLAAKDQVQLLTHCLEAAPEPGGRGQRGFTRLRLAGLSPDQLKSALTAAWRHGAAAGGPRASTARVAPGRP